MCVEGDDAALCLVNHVVLAGAVGAQAEGLDVRSQALQEGLVIGPHEARVSKLMWFLQPRERSIDEVVRDPHGLRLGARSSSNASPHVVLVVRRLQAPLRARRRHLLLGVEDLVLDARGAGCLDRLADVLAPCPTGVEPLVVDDVVRPLPAVVEAAGQLHEVCGQLERGHDHVAAWREPL